MIVYQETKRQFIDDTRTNEIDRKIEEKVLEKLHRRTAKNEFMAWRNSMQYMSNILDDGRIPDDAKVAIEYRLPSANMRIDMVISGKGEDDRETAIIVELKQWQKVEKVPTKDAIVKTVIGGGIHETSHPAYQAWAYASLLYDYNADIRENHILLEPCAYLHNYEAEVDDDLYDDIYKYYLDKAPVFTRHDVLKLRDFIARFIKKGNVDVLYHIENGRILPSKSLQENITSLLLGNKEFTLIDDQKIIYERALAIARLQSNKKRVYIISGGPGTGKSVLAINMLVGILNLDQNVIYVTKNSAPRNVYRKKLTAGSYRKAYVDNLFQNSGKFYDAPKDAFDCIITDEAHRLNARSGRYKNYGENQIKEIISATKIAIFFVDDEQIVTIDDIGSTEAIRKWAMYFDAEIYEDTLISQFRCSGSDSYLSWIDSVFEIKEDVTDDFDHDYDLRILDTPDEVRKLIIEKNKVDNRSRMVAGYCWDWIKQYRSDPDVYDIVIGDFKASWNLNNTDTWAIDDGSVEQIGCIHTVQGLEFDYVGVIIGEDLRYEDGHIITDHTKRASTDMSLKGIKKLMALDSKEASKLADKIIKDTYKVLMTRGMKGCYVYCVDKALSIYLKERLKGR